MKADTMDTTLHEYNFTFQCKNHPEAWLIWISGNPYEQSGA